MCRAFVRAGLGAVALLTLAGSAAADTITDWNLAALNAVQSTSTPPPRASRALAMIHGAVYDAVNSVDRTFQPYMVNTVAAPGTSREAAAAVAAFTVASSLFPTQAATFTALRDTQLAAIPDSPGKAAGMTLGQTIGLTMNFARTNDQANNPGAITFPGSTTPGRWRPAADNPVAAALPHWGSVTPFAVPSGASFRPGVPPTITSAQYAAALNEVKQLGAINSPTRTPEQADIARAWAFNAGTKTPPGAWNLIAQDISQSRGLSLTENARMFAAMNVAMADAAICAWDCKYTQDMWRPVDAIRLADTDGNALTDPDLNWTPLLATPNHPTYVSGHSTFSRAAANTLAALLGSDAINVNFQGDFGVSRLLTSLDGAANEAGLSRIYGGIHFSFDNVFGQQIGADVSSYVLANYFQAIPAPGAGTMLALVGVLAMRRRR